MEIWKLRAMLLALFCTFIVIGWFVIFTYAGRPLDAGRGGAIGVILSFAALFLLSIDRYQSIDIYDEASRKLLKNMSEEGVSRDDVLPSINSGRIKRLKTDLARLRIQTKWENISLAISSFISTLFWGFGDWLSSAVLSFQ